ncbi:MAG: NADH-quinone oxidoreductase subunit C [Bacteroidia bacterium]|jgi:NADH-quinone oxidoreductase subunit C|nr:NADH-quinone oxidoreductase subunit C [Bacteroidia bacterium]
MTTINNEYIVNKVQQHFGNALKEASESYGILNIEISAEKAYALIDWFKHDSEIKASFLTDVCGAQFPDLVGKEFCVIYHLHSFINNIRIRIKAFIPKDNPTIASITPLFPAANWQERETFDFYGIVFVGHPNLKRIVNVDEMDYFPLRKEYPLEDGTRTDKEDKYFGR